MTEFQFADIFTKALPTLLFERHRSAFLSRWDVRPNSRVFYNPTFLYCWRLQLLTVIFFYTLLCVQFFLVFIYIFVWTCGFQFPYFAGFHYTIPFLKLDFNFISYDPIAFNLGYLVSMAYYHGILVLVIGGILMQNITGSFHWQVGPLPFGRKHGWSSSIWTFTIGIRTRFCFDRHICRYTADTRNHTGEPLI